MLSQRGLKSIDTSDWKRSFESAQGITATWRRLQNVSKTLYGQRLIQQPNRAVERRWTQVHVALRHAELPMSGQLPGHELLPPCSLLMLTTLDRNDAGWTVIAQGPDQARCPRCRRVSIARHSRYVRTLKDLPALGAKRKGLHYGTIVVDLERRTVVDVLDTYDVEAVQRWFSAHPRIHTICRDRNGRYAKAARTGAPAATQVADRFHLVHNLRETIERELALHRAHLRVRRLALDTQIARQRRQETQDLFDRFKGLQATKLPMTVIAQQLGLNRRRFDRWAKVDTLPTRSPMPPRPRSAEPFREQGPFLLKTDS